MTPTRHANALRGTPYATRIAVGSVLSILGEQRAILAHRADDGGVTMDTWDYCTELIIERLPLWEQCWPWPIEAQVE